LCRYIVYEKHFGLSLKGISWDLCLSQFGTLARLLQSEPAPKVVKVTLSRKVPLSGDELKAYEEQIRLSKEATEIAMKAQEEEVKASQSSGPPGTSSDSNMSEASIRRSVSGSLNPQSIVIIHIHIGCKFAYLSYR
jgi:hypothetical protein